MSQIQPEKKKKSIKSIIFYTIYIALLGMIVVSIIMNIGKKDNEMKSFFGYNFAVVQTGSMVDGGFDIGDFVFIKEVDASKKDLKVGDIIVFYYNFCDPYDQSFQFQIDASPDFKANHTITDPETWVAPNNPDPHKKDRWTRQDAIDAGAILVFHRIINIYFDDYGNKYFETLGDSNDNDADDVYVRDDFVVAEYGGQTPFISTILSYIATPIGLIIVFLLPVALMVITQIVSFIKEMRFCSTVSALLRRKATIHDLDTKDFKLAQYLAPEEKAYLYDISPQEDKEDIAIILWEEEISEKLELYEKSREEFYQAFANELPEKKHNKVWLLKAKADIIRQNPSISDEDAEAKAKEKLLK